jgi:TRAP-type C4-dicarboxylate transport system permease small subunit
MPHAPDTRAEPRALRWLSRITSWVTTAAIACAAAGLLVSLVAICWAVVMRYAFNSPPVWVDDAVGLLLVVTVMAAAAETLRRGEHIGVDLFTERLGPRAARWAQIGSMLAVLLVAIILVANGWQTAMESREYGIVTEGQLEWPIWRLMLLLPAGGALMALVAVEALWRLSLGLPVARAVEAGEAE